MSNHQNWENGSFEEFIRRSVEDPQLEFDPQAWEAMEKKLDARAGGGTHAGNAGKIGGGLVALLIMSLLGWYLLSGTEDNTDREVERQATEQLSASEQGNGTASGGLQEQERIPEEAEVEQQAATPSGSGYAGGTIKSEKVKLSSRENSGERKRIVSTSSSSGSATGEPPQGTANAAAASGNGGLNAGALGRKGSGAEIRAGQEDEWPKADAASKALQRMPWQDFVLEDRKSLPQMQVVQEGKETAGAQPEAVIVPPIHSSLPLSLSLSLAPDFSGMGEGVSARLGAGAGFHLEYRVLPRLGLQTGLVYSQKNYLANSSYSPYDFGYYYPKPDHIDASCGVLDIPLNLRYYLLPGKKHSFFLSSGMSSYLMKREDYTMVFADEQYDDFTYELRNENRHYFAVYNFSAGYEARISPRWAIQAEPFLKIPTRGLGAGSIRLNSMGAFMHLKYQIGRLGK